MMIIVGCTVNNLLLNSSLEDMPPENSSMVDTESKLGRINSDETEESVSYTLDPTSPIFEILETPTKEYSYKEKEYFIGEEIIPYPQFDLISDIEATNKINTDISQLIHSIAENDSKISVFNYQYQITFENEEIIGLVFNYNYYQLEGAYPIEFFITRTYTVKDGNYYQLPEDVYEQIGFLDALLQKENLVNFGDQTKESGLEYIKARQEDLEKNLYEINDSESQVIQFYFDKNGGVCFVFETIHAIGDYVVLRLNLA